MCADTYTVTITDATGCSKSETFDVGEPDAIVDNLIITDESCSPGGDGRADASGATGGTGVLTFSWAVAGGSSDVISGRPAGDDTLTITDSRGCSLVVPFTIGSGANIINTPTITDVECFGDSTGAIFTTVVGGVGPYSYSWLDTMGVVVDTSEDVQNLSPGLYDLVIKDANNCIDTLDETSIFYEYDHSDHLL